MPKHYAKTKWNDLGAIQYWGDDGFKAENISRSKAVYRRRERRTLDRMLAAEIEGELVLMELAESEAAEAAAEAAYVADSVSYWMDECIDAYEEVECLRRELAEAEARLAEAEMMFDFWDNRFWDEC